MDRYRAEALRTGPCIGYSLTQRTELTTNEPATEIYVLRLYVGAHTHSTRRYEVTLSLFLSLSPSLSFLLANETLRDQRVLRVRGSLRAVIPSAAFARLVFIASR